MSGLSYKCCNLPDTYRHDVETIYFRCDCDLDVPAVGATDLHNLCIDACRGILIERGALVVVIHTQLMCVLGIIITAANVIHVA